MFLKGKTFNFPAGFECLTYRPVVDPLIHCATLLNDNFGKETIHTIMLDFIVDFDRKYVTTWRCPIQPRGIIYF